MHRTPETTPRNLLIALLILTNGCDDRATQIALDAADRQAEQNATMAALHEEVASGTRELVAADAQARQEIVGVHHELQAERTRLDGGWTDLHQERRQIARERRTESLVVPAIQVGGGLALVIVLLGFCWYALVRLRSGDSADAELSALLIAELLAEEQPVESPGSPSPSALVPPPVPLSLPS